jgi:catechol 2,3-dioxygenase-like lactoylglutathione lyase family enzyme
MAKRTPPFPFGNIEHVSMVVEDLGKTVRFYEQLFGFVVEREIGNPELGVRAVVLTKQGRSIELFEYRDDQPEQAQRKGIVRGTKVSPERFRAGIRGIALRPRSEEKKGGRRIVRAVNREPSAEPNAAARGRHPTSLKDPNGITLRPLGTAARRKKPGTRATSLRLRPAARKRKIKQ